MLTRPWVVVRSNVPVVANPRCFAQRVDEDGCGQRFIQQRHRLTTSYGK